MRKMLKIELLKLFESFRFWISILGIGIGLLINSLEVMRYTSFTTIDNLFMTIAGDMFFLVCFVLCIVGGGYGFCTEQKNHCVIYYVLRDKIANYTMAKTIVSFLGGFLVTFWGCILGIIMITGKIFLFRQYNGSIIPEINGLGVMMAYILGFSILCGVMSVFAMLISVFIVDYFIVMAMPILVYFMVLNITGWISLPVWLDITYIYFIQFNNNSFVLEKFVYDIGYALLFSIWLGMVMYKIMKKGIERKIEHG